MGAKMNDLFLYEELENLEKYNKISDEIPQIIKSNLAKKIVLRDYQKQAIRYFKEYYESKNKQIHTAFHMATGSGKTVVMASLMLYLYEKGYNKFVFFVNQTNVLEKTIENFTNAKSNKYLFSDVLEISGLQINIKKVDIFSKANKDIEIIFTTTQKLYLDLNNAKENCLSLNDFEEQKIVFISDESHHLNSNTKDEEAKNSWEYGVNTAFRAHKDSILLEFSATLELNDKNVREKYKDKVVYNYPLINFRNSGYTKDFANFASDTSFWTRALIALILSEYRRYLFAKLKLNIKPVVMLKSQFITESKEFYKEFFTKLEKLSNEEINTLYSLDEKTLNKALDYFKKDDGFGGLIAALKTSFAKENSLLIDSQSITKDKQLLLNSLEDESNAIRVIFAVDMLNEGWDVLNLYDIVRLYDTRQGSGKAGKIGSYTIKEAQLIGRGARYCPFSYNDENKFKRKFDSDLDNEYRLLETMLFHSKNDSKYISELKEALIYTGLCEKDGQKLQYVLKDEFKNSEFYQKALVFRNKKIEKKECDSTKFLGSLKTKNYNFTAPKSNASVNMLFSKNSPQKNQEKIAEKQLKFKEIDLNILLGAFDCFNELSFSILKQKYPPLKSKKEFLTSSEFLGNSTICIKYSDTLTSRHIFKACKNALKNVANYISSLEPSYIGSVEFMPIHLKQVLKDKTIYVLQIDENGGKGDSQNECKNDDFRLDLSNEDWYVFNDNYGTSEEKLFIKYFKHNIAPKLYDKGLEFYVIRNERVPELAIYSYENGERFEPDFLLFIRTKKNSNDTKYQIFIEPKGTHLLEVDSWKEEFLKQIYKNAKLDMVNNVDYKIFGLPFFNNDKKDEFIAQVDDFLNNL